MGIEEAAHIIQLAVAPVFLLAAISQFLIVLTNRLARIVDRARALVEGGPNAPPKEAANDLAIHIRRSKLINWAIWLCTASALFICTVVITLFLGALVKLPMFQIVAGLFIVAMMSLIAALLCFLREVFLAVTALKLVDGGTGS